jgi:hypothetical protein
MGYLWQENAGALNGFSSILWGNIPRGSEQMTLTELKQKYSFTKHLLFSILKGRTVIIYAHHSSQRSVKLLLS